MTTTARPEWIDLAADIRAIDGNHDTGAGPLAQALAERGWTRARAPRSELDVERLAEAMRACLPEGALDGIRDVSLAAKAIAHEYGAAPR